MRRVSLFLVAQTLLACGGEEAPPPKTPADQGSAPAASSAAPSAAVASPARPISTAVMSPEPGPVVVTPLPERLQPPSKVACNFSGTPVSDRPLTLRFDGKSEPFATIYRPTGIVKFTAPAGSADEGFFAEFDAGAATLRAYVQATDVPLYASAPSVFGGILSPSGEAQLTPVSGEPGSLNVSVSIDPSVVELAEKQVVGSRPCNFFSLAPTTFDPLKATGSEARKLVAIRPGKVKLAKELNGGTFATLTAVDTSRLAYALAFSGSQTRIAWAVGPVTVFGWVPRAQLSERTEEGGIVGGALPTQRETGVAAWKSARCEKDMALVAEVGGAKRVVGSVRSGKVFQIGPEQRGFRGVAFPQTDLLASDKAFLWISASEAASCTML